MHILIPPLQIVHAIHSSAFAKRSQLILFTQQKFLIDYAEEKLLVVLLKYKMLHLLHF